MPAISEGISFARVTKAKIVLYAILWALLVVPLCASFFYGFNWLAVILSPLIALLALPAILMLMFGGFLNWLPWEVLPILPFLPQESESRIVLPLLLIEAIYIYLLACLILAVYRKIRSRH